MIQLLKPRGQRRGERRRGMPLPTPRGERRAPRPNWVTGDPGPEADALAIDLMLGYDPRGEFR